METEVATGKGDRLWEENEKRNQRLFRHEGTLNEMLTISWELKEGT